MWPERKQGNTGGNMLLLMALLTILAFGGCGVVLLELVQHRDAWSVTLGSAALWEQLLLGVVAGVFNGYPNAYNGGWFPALIPTATLESGHWGLNVALVPPLKDRLYGAVSFQVKYRFR